MKNGNLVLRSFDRGKSRDFQMNLLWTVAIVGMGVGFSDTPLTALPYAGAAVALVGLFSATGIGLGRRALAGVLLGVFPLLAAYGSMLLGHVCTPGGCVSLCAPFCCAGGVIAGALLARMTLASPQPLSAWVAGSLIVLCTGAIGCACVGAAGVAGMCAGLLSSSFAWWLRTRRFA